MKRSILAGSLTLSLLGGLITPAVVATQAQAASNEASTTSADSTERTTQATSNQVISGLEILVNSVNTVRAGGDGAIELDVAHRADDAVAARKVVLHAKFGRGVRATSASGPDWKCRTSRQQVRCTKTRIEPSSDGNSVLISLSGARSLRNGSVKARTWVTWREPRGARHRAAGVTPPDRKAKQGRWATYLDRTTGLVPTSRSLAMKVARLGPAKRLTDGVGEDDLVLFSADIKGLDDTMTPLVWRQVCTRRAELKADPECEGVAPRATLLQPKTDDEAEKDSALSVQLPVVKKPTKLIFEASLMDSGARVAGRASVIAMPFKPITFTSDVDTVEEFAALTNDMSTKQNLRGARQAFTKGTIRGKAKPKAGRQVNLRLRLPHKRVSDVTWSATAGPRTLLSGAKRNGQSLRFKAPSSMAGHSAVIEARATLRNGRHVEFSKLLTFAAPKHRESTRDYTLMATATAEQAALAVRAQQRVDKRNARLAGADGRLAVTTAVGTLCTIARNIQSRQIAQPPSQNVLDPIPDFVLDGGAMVWVGDQATVDMATCTESTKISLDNAVIMYGTHMFSGVRGQISIEGLQIRGGTYQVPEEWTKEIPGLDGADARLDFEVPKTLPVSAKLDRHGSWGALGGEVSFPTGLELIPLPSGWRFQPSTFRFEMTGLIALTVTARAPSTEAKTAESLGRVSITGAVSPSGELQVDVVAANLVLLEDADGNEVALDFDGSLEFAWEDDPAGGSDSELAMQVAPDISASVSNVKLSEYVVAEKIGVNWTPGRIGGDFNLRIGDAGNTVSLVRSSFVYEGSQSWQVLASYEGAWDVGAGLVIHGLKGEIEKDGKRLNISLAGDATGWKPSTAFELSSIRADLTNKCSPQTVKPGNAENGAKQECDTGAVRIDLDAVGVLNLNGDRVDWTSSTSFDLGTKKYTIRGTISNADGLGPAEFNLRNISIAVSNQGTRRLCSPTQPGTDETVFQITALGTVMGADVDFAGEYGTDSGTCFIGDVRPGQTKSLDLPNPEAFSNLQFAWVSQDSMLDLQAGQARATGKQLIISANYTVPREWNQIGVTQGNFFGVLGYSANRMSLSAEVSVAFGNPGEPGPIIFGEAGTNNLTIDEIGFEVSYTGTGEFSLTAAALMTYRTVANTATDTIDSSTPFSVAISAGTRGLVVESKVDADRGKVPADTGAVSGNDKQAYSTPAQIENAFGTSGLIVRQLGLTAMIGPNTSIAFNADVTLPERWSSAMGMHPHAQIAMGGALSQTNPCFKFDMKVAPDRAGPNDFVVDLGKGLLAARQLRLIVAPTGCVLPGNEYIAPGFGMTFDGLIGGTFEVRVAIDVVLPTTVNRNLFIDADIKVDELSLGSVVTIDQTVLKFTVDTAAQLYELRVIGGIDVFGQRASIDAYFRAQGLGNITLNATSNVDLSLLGVASSNAKLDIAFEMVNFDVKVLKIDAVMNFKVLGTTVAGMRAALIYDEGEVIDLELAVSVGLNIIVGSFSGTLGVEYFYDCQGVKLCASKQYTHRNMKMYLKGNVRILFWRTSFNLDIVDYREPVSSDRQARQHGQWKGQAEAEATTPDDIVWTSARKTSLTTGVVVNTWSSRVVSVKYDSAGKVTADGGEINRSQSSGRGNVIVTACIVKPGTRICRDKEEFSYRAEVYFQSRKIVLPQGQITGEAVLDGKCAFRCKTSSVEFSGKDWKNITKMLNKARADYAQANPGKSLPPVKMWSKDRPALEIGSVNSTMDGLDWMSNGSRFARYGSSDQIPLTGDWDGNGYSELGHFTIPAPLNQARWAQRQANGSTHSFQRFACTGARNCGPIEPPGTAQYQRIESAFRNGSSGFIFPIVGDWDEATTQHKSVDDLGIVAGDYRGSLTWRLWPRGQAELQFFFGGVRNAVVDRPVTGDWDGDGTTDIGVYRPPATPGQVGTWLLVTSESLRNQLKAGQVIQPDFRISFGSFGSLPVTGDWDNDGVDGIGVVTRASTLGRPNEWSLRNFANFDCPSDCQSDVTRSEGAWGSQPVVGRWKSAY